MQRAICYCICVCFSLFFTVASYTHANTDDAPARYQDGKTISVLIVPGHDGEFSGAVYNGIKEADINLVLANKLRDELVRDPRLEVIVSRDKDDYIPSLQRYFKKNEQTVKRFLKKNKSITKQMVDNGRIDILPQVPHNNAPAPMAYRLYAINKWADGRHFDFIIHIHFNDDGMRMGNKRSNATGYSVYVPAQGLRNADSSKSLGGAVGAQLDRVLYPSNLPIENDNADDQGIIQDFNLIALGANRTLKVPSMLIEYSYIYEPSVSNELFPAASNVFAQATAKGIQQYLHGIEIAGTTFAYHWNNDMHKSTIKNQDVLMLQYALKDLDYYPPKGFNRDACAFDGTYGKCTEAAVKEFQTENDLIVDGAVSSEMREALNGMYAFSKNRENNQ